MEIETIDLNDRIDSALRSSPHLHGRQLSYHALDGHVVLHGSVRTFFEKQMVQEAVRRVDGVKRIANEVLVLSDTAVPAPHVRV